MLNITIDTCVWLELIKTDFTENNLLEEICFLIEGKHIKHIVPSNVIEEWNRNKILQLDSILAYFRQKDQDLLNLLRNNKELSSLYKPDKINQTVNDRINRIDIILNSFSEKAEYDDPILLNAARRNLGTLAPNHKKDSFRDTVNILTLINHIKTKGYPGCIFTTIDGDFGITSKQKYILHSHLTLDFQEANISYTYFGNKKNVNDDVNSFGDGFISKIKLEDSSLLHIFQNYLKDKNDKAAAAEVALATKKSIATTAIASPDADYLENIKHIDMTLSKKVPTSFEQEMIQLLIRRHDSYKQYFLNNIGNNGMV